MGRRPRGAEVWRELIPDQTVLKLKAGERIRLSASQFEGLFKAFLTEIQAKLL
jgi:hypothetical protein